MSLNLSRFALVSLVALSVLPAFAQGTKPAPIPAGPPLMTKPVAKPVPAVKLPADVFVRVNGKDIKADMLLDTLQQIGGGPLRDQIIQLTIIEQEAKKRGVTVTPAELAQEIKVQKEQSVAASARGGSVMTWSEIAARDGYTEGFILWRTRLVILARKTFLKSMESQVPKFEDQRKFAHILIPTMDLNPAPDAKPLTPEEQKAKDEAALKKANEILADIKAGKVMFADAAKSFSADTTSAQQGGNLEYTPRGVYDPAFETAAWGLKKPEEMAQVPVRSRFGYHIIKLVQTGATAPAADKKAYQTMVKSQMMQQGQNGQALGAWVNDLMRAAKIEYNMKPTLKPVPAKAAPATKK